MFDALQTRTLPEPLRVAFYGALFAMAALDQGIDPEEWALIYDQLDTHGLSPAGEERLKGFILSPPRLLECLTFLGRAEEAVRFGTMINLLDVAYADERLADAEAEALDEAAAILLVDPFQVDAMKDFIDALRQIRRAGRGEGAALQAVRVATERLYAAGIPSEAVRFSSAFLYEPSLEAVTGAHPVMPRP
jgi:uncharacterized tellurite resistance protein B-like protein